jgi:DnaJ-class molecular chaperone
VDRDLYADLGVLPGAQAHTLRNAWHWYRDNFSPDDPRRVLAADAYAVVGDPRLRAEYDAGRTVSVRTGRYYTKLPWPFSSPPEGWVARLDTRLWRRKGWR